MGEAIRPRLLQLGGEEEFAAYQKEFGRLYQLRQIFDILGNRVVFDSSVCRHICTKDDGDGRRVWSQERAERIPWILAALTNGTTEIRPDKDIANRWNYLLVVPADPSNELPQEYYCVVVEKLNSDVVTLVTAFATDHSGWSLRRRAGKAIYPIKQKDKA